MRNRTAEKCRSGFKGAVRGTILPLLALLLVTGCGPPDHEEEAFPYGDPKGTFYSLSVLQRFPPGLNAETARGRELYMQKCAICHGEAGDGKGFNAYNLKSSFGVQPFDFRAPDGAVRLSIDELKKAITYGGTAVNRSQYMPPWGLTFGAYDVDCITAYVWESLMNKKADSQNGTTS